MLAFPWNPFPILQTARLVLKEIGLADLGEIFELRSDPRVMQYIPRPLAGSLQDAKIFIEAIQASQTNQEAINWGIFQTEDTGLVGTICLWNISGLNARAELGYLLKPTLHGKGLMQEAVTRVIEFGFYAMNLHSIEAQVAPENYTSIRLLERTGFQREAYFRENFYHEGKFQDTEVYTLLTPKKLL